MFPSVFHFLSTTVLHFHHPRGSHKAALPLSRRGQDIYLCVAVEHSDPRFSRFKDSPEREGVGVGGQQGFSKKWEQDKKKWLGEKSSMPERCLVTKWSQKQKVRICFESWSKKLWTKKKKKPKGKLKWEWEMWLVGWLWKPPAFGWQQGQWECPLLVRPLNSTHPLHKPAVL